MPRAALPTEAQALVMAELLLRYAVENVADLPRPVIATLSATMDANAHDAWNDQVAADFWCAYQTLCDLVRPVTIDTLLTNLPRSSPAKRALSHSTAARYLYALIALLCISTVLGFLASTTSSLNADVQKLVTQADELTDKLASANDVLASELGTTAFTEASPKQRPAIDALQEQLKQQSYLLDTALQKNLTMSKLLLFGWNYELAPGNFREATSTADIRAAIRDYQATRRDVAADRLKAQILISIISAIILPIVLGAMGACAYVTRLISDQIKSSTFSPTSPIRHLVRICLGSLAGVVIGFGGITTDVGLSASALAFLAGYAIEPVFATLDNIADKFRY